MDNSKVDDIVSMLDKLMGNDGGHVNVVVNENTSSKPNIETNNSLECAGNVACSIPTMHVGIDDNIEE